MQIRDNFEEEISYYENYAAKCKQPSAKAFLKFMSHTDAKFDFFKLFNVNCLIELMFVTILPEYKGKELSVTLTNASIALAKELNKGKNVKLPVDDRKQLQVTSVPELITCICTAPVNQKMRKKLGYEVAAVVNYGDLVYKGKTFASRIGPQALYMTLEFQRI